MNRKACYVLDLDGTVYMGSVPIQPSVDFIVANWKNTDFYFLSNNTSKAPETYVIRLNAMGIPAELSQILSPITPLVAYLRAENIGSAYLVGNADFTDCMARTMPELVQNAADVEAVILAYDTELTYKKLCESALLLHNPQVRFFATHPDLVCPSPEGSLPDVGSFLALYHTATGRQPERIFGKPEPAVLAPLLARYRKEDMVMVGDRLSTDKKLAENAGIDFILVLSGEARREDLDGLAHQPTLVVETLGDVIH